ncbi:amino acid--tRNA ligase-related protein [Patescibacteria group bacterium]
MQKTKLISEIYRAGRDWLYQNDYTELTVPRIVRASGACENVNTLYSTVANDNPKWHSNSAYLAQTGQLYLEANVPKYNRVFCDGPSFRAEETVDARHLTEFRMIEIELATDFDGLLDEIQGFINQIVSHIIYINESRELGLSKEQIDRLKKVPRVFPQTTYDQAIKSLQDHGIDIAWGDDLKHDHEMKLVEIHGGVPLFITRFPDPLYDHGKDIEVEKFFNMIPDPENSGRVLSCDCILPFSGEAVGAARRLSEVEEMISRLQKSKMYARLTELGGSIEDFSWYINQLRTHGSVPHAGCGFGMARIVQFVLGQGDIRNAVNFVSNKETLI